MLSVVAFATQPGMGCAVAARAELLQLCLRVLGIMVDVAGVQGQEVQVALARDAQGAQHGTAAFAAPSGAQVGFLHALLPIRRVEIALHRGNLLCEELAPRRSPCYNERRTLQMAFLSQ